MLLSFAPSPLLLPKPAVGPGVNNIALPRSSRTAFGYGTHQRLMQSLNYKPCRTLSGGCPARLSHTLRCLLTESQTFVHLTFLSMLPHSLYRSNKHRYSRDRRSRCPTSRVNHLRPHEPAASTCNGWSGCRFDERRTNKQSSRLR